MAPSSRRAAGAGPPSGKSGRRAPGRRTGRGTSGGARGVPGPTGKRARAHQGESRPRCRRRPVILTRFHPRRVEGPSVGNWKAPVRASMIDHRLHAPATLRNRDAILGVLRGVLPAKGVVLEVASGSGEHVVHFARELPGLTFQPSEARPEALSSIAAWVDA